MRNIHCPSGRHFGGAAKWIFGDPLRSGGGTRQAKPRANNPNRKVTADTVAKMKDAYGQGRSIAQVALIFGVSVHYTRAILIDGIRDSEIDALPRRRVTAA